MLVLYRLTTLLIYWILYPLARFKAARGSELWRGRLGGPVAGAPRHIWMHAASVGEVKVLGYLIEYLRRQDRGLTFHVTTVTEAGFQTATAVFSHDRKAVTLAYFPLDTVPVMKTLIDRIRPSLLLFAETEIWPNLVQVAARKGIPIVLVNGRMSEKAARRYRMLRRTFSKILDHYHYFFFKSEIDAERFRGFGVTEDRYTVAGDMKFDAPLPPRSVGRRREMRYRAGVGDNDFLLVAGSTRPGEEAILLDVFGSVFMTHGHFRMILAPRHVERVPEVTALLDKAGIGYGIYGHKSEAKPVVVVDKLGVLNDLYLAADLAFVGGTLVDIGGHNLLEPIWAGTPVVFGPSVTNVRDAARYILNHNYGVQVPSGEDLTALVMEVIDGAHAFSVKTDSDVNQSATAVVGRHILDTVRSVGTSLEENPST